MAGSVLYFTNPLLIYLLLFNLLHLLTQPKLKPLLLHLQRLNPRPLPLIRLRYRLTNLPQLHLHIHLRPLLLLILPPLHPPLHLLMRLHQVLHSLSDLEFVLSQAHLDLLVFSQLPQFELRGSLRAGLFRLLHFQLDLSEQLLVF